MIAEIIIPAAIFTGFITLITLAVSISYKLLTPQHKVEIKINKSRIHTIKAGENLLSALQQNKVLLPSSCGGKGTCGLCRCQLSPSPAALPTEKSFLSSKEINTGTRLACQHHLDIDLDITVPDYVLNAQSINATIKQTKQLSPLIREFVLSLPVPISFNAGDYVLVEVPTYKLDALENKEATNRAYSISSYPGEGENELKLTVTLALSPDPAFIDHGVGTSWLFSLKAGDTIGINGPFGEFHIQETEREKCFIGGGAGMAPLRSQINTLLRRNSFRGKVSFWYGARSSEALIYSNEMNEMTTNYGNFSFHPALSNATTDDHPDLPHCYIHEAVHNLYLQDHEAPEEIEYYLCGPAPMIEATIKMLHSVGVDDDMIFFDNFG